MKKYMAILPWISSSGINPGSSSTLSWARVSSLTEIRILSPLSDWMYIAVSTDMSLPSTIGGSCWAVLLLFRGQTVDYNGGKQEEIKCTWGTHEDWSGRQKSSNMRWTWVQCFMAVTNSILAIMAHLIPTAKQPRQGTLYSWGEIQAISKYKAKNKKQALRANVLRNKILVDLFNYWDVQNMLPSDEVEVWNRWRLV